jgi:hypothetical protein
MFFMLQEVLSLLFPLAAALLLTIGIRRNLLSCIISALWLALITLIIHYNAAGREVLGSYFNYQNALIYTINLILFIISFLKIISHLTIYYSIVKLMIGLLQGAIIVVCLFILANLWINAYFISSNQMINTPIVQVALMRKPTYCNYKYLFYKITSDGLVSYLCPNYYGLIPHIGYLPQVPDFLKMHVPKPNTKKDNETKIIKDSEKLNILQ